MRQLAKFDFCNVKESYSEIILPKQVPVILNHNWERYLGIVDIIIEFGSKDVWLDFSLYNRVGINSVTDFIIKPIVSTTYSSLKTITITGFSLNKKL